MHCLPDCFRGRKDILALLLSLALLGHSWPVPAFETVIVHGRWQSRSGQMVLQRAREVTSAGERIKMLSAAFLGTFYQHDTLTPAHAQTEKLVVDLEHVDCLTFLEYLEALRASPDLESLEATLQTVRYQGGVVSFATRKHFFSDWAADTTRIQDVSAMIAGPYRKRITRNLNAERTSPYFLPGVTPRVRDIAYVPTQVLLQQTYMARLHTGDYLGLLSSRSDLDVTHVGIAIKDDFGRWQFRHASARPEHYRVVDRPLAAAFRRKFGVVVFRPLPWGSGIRAHGSVSHSLYRTEASAPATE